MDKLINYVLNFPRYLCTEFGQSWYFGLIACCLNRGKTATQARSRKCIEQWILDQEKKRSKEFSSEIDELNKEADRLADRLEGHMKDKRKRDFRKQKAAKSKPLGALGGRHRQQDITGDSFTLCGSKCHGGSNLVISKKNC
jgi:hypothetical protein